MSLISRIPADTPTTALSGNRRDCSDTSNPEQRTGNWLSHWQIHWQPPGSRTSPPRMNALLTPL